jgi:hypothetical protein
MISFLSRPVRPLSTWTQSKLSFYHFHLEKFHVHHFGIIDNTKLIRFTVVISVIIFRFTFLKT